MAVAMLVLPTIDETPGPIVGADGSVAVGGFPADDLYEFRLFCLGTQVVMWTTIGLIFATSVSSLLGPVNGVAVFERVDGHRAQP